MKINLDFSFGRDCWMFSSSMTPKEREALDRKFASLGYRLEELADSPFLPGSQAGVKIWARPDGSASLSTLLGITTRDSIAYPGQSMGEPNLAFLRVVSDSPIAVTGPQNMAMDEIENFLRTLVLAYERLGKTITHAEATIHVTEGA